MAGVNKVILVGNLGKDPEIKNFDNGGSVARFSVATSENYKDKNGERQTKTEWHNVVCWRKLAEIAEKYLTKGSQVYIEGKLRTRSYNDAQGVLKYTTEVEADTFTMLGSRQDGGGNSSNDMASSSAAPAASNGGGFSDDEGDDLPF